VGEVRITCRAQERHKWPQKPADSSRASLGSGTRSALTNVHGREPCAGCVPSLGML
jgi:hypothetical protein